MESAVLFCPDPEHNNQQMIPGNGNKLFFNLLMMILCCFLDQVYLHFLHLILKIIYLFILAALGLSCGVWTLSCGIHLVGDLEAPPHFNNRNCG